VTRGRGRPPRGTVIEKKPVALHWVRVASLHMTNTLCGQPLSSVQVAGEFAEVTCKQCKRLGIANPQHQAKPRRVDSLMMRAFHDAEGELKSALHEAKEALAAATRPGDTDEINAQLGGALRRIVDILDPPTD